VAAGVSCRAHPASPNPASIATTAGNFLDVIFATSPYYFLIGEAGKVLRGKLYEMKPISP
jgi:hypothetical protein